eukprot:scaffold436153_cov43-Prasinocladus_malaysianus.AAC.1
MSGRLASSHLPAVQAMALALSLLHRARVGPVIAPPRYRKQLGASNKGLALIFLQPQHRHGLPHSLREACQRSALRASHKGDANGRDAITGLQE